MEIQTFFLAEQITRFDVGRHDVRRAVVSHFSFTAEMSFPVRFTLPGLLVLRRENTFGDAPVCLRFDLVDEDGRPAGRPHRWLAKGVFTAGSRFYYLMAKIDFEFPGPGRYSLDITNVDEMDASVYHYAVDIVPEET